MVTPSKSKNPPSKTKTLAYYQHLLRHNIINISTKTVFLYYINNATIVVTPSKTKTLAYYQHLLRHNIIIITTKTVSLYYINNATIVVTPSK